MNGFSLLEILIVIAVLSILGIAASGLYVNFARNVELEETAAAIVGKLKEARGKAMAGEDGYRWGVHFVNNGDDYYELFSTPGDYLHASTSVKETNYLPSSFSFAAPPPASTTDIIFSKIRATTTATSSVTVSSPYGAETIAVTPIGNIY